MDIDYLRERKRRYRRQQKLKLILTVLLCSLALLFGIIWIGMRLSASGDPGQPSSNLGNGPSGTGAVGTPEGTPKPTSEAAPTLSPTPEATPTPTPTPIPKVTIDAGHGGRDGGSTRDGVKESDINLAIALEVELLLKEEGYDVYMIRSTDEFIAKEERPLMSNENEADLFVSIHQNTEGGTTATGTEVWYNDKLNADSKLLATYMAQEITSRTGARNRGAKVGNDLAVLKGQEIPACLIECGFLSSEAERELLQSAEYQKKIAEGIVAAIRRLLPLE